MLEDEGSEMDVEVRELNYDRESGRFWMRCIMGDYWFQRVTSSFPFGPRIVRFVDSAVFVAFDLISQADQFTSWLSEAGVAVDEGFRTVRG